MREDTEYHPWPPFKPVWAFDVPTVLNAQYSASNDAVGSMIEWLRKNTKDRWYREEYEEEMEYYSSDYSMNDYGRGSSMTVKATHITIHFANMHDVVVFKTFWL